MKRWLRHQLLRLVSWRRHWHSANREYPQQRLLIIPYNALGDMAMTLPLLARLRHQRPDLQIDLLASPRNADLLKDYPGLNAIHRIDINAKGFAAARRWRQWRKGKAWHTILYLGERATFITQWRLQQLPCQQLWALPCKRKGLPTAAINRLFDRLVGDGAEPHFARRMASCAQNFSSHGDDAALDFQLHLAPVPKDLASSRAVVLINPQGSQSGNTMSEQQCSALVDGCSAAGWQPALFEHCMAFLSTAQRHQVFSLPSPSVRDAIGWLHAVDLVITTDTAIGHLACAEQRPTIILRRNEQWRADCDPLCGNPIVLFPSESPGSLSDIAITAIIAAGAKQLERFKGGDQKAEVVTLSTTLQT